MVTIRLQPKPQKPLAIPLGAVKEVMTAERTVEVKMEAVVARMVVEKTGKEGTVAAEKTEKASTVVAVKLEEARTAGGVSPSSLNVINAENSGKNTPGFTVRGTCSVYPIRCPMVLKETAAMHCAKVSATLQIGLT